MRKLKKKKKKNSLQKQIDYLKQRAEEIDGQRRMSTNKQSQLMKLITSTAPVVLDSLKSTGGQDDQPPPLQALISKLSEAIEEDEPREKKSMIRAPPANWSPKCGATTYGEFISHGK